MSNCSGPGCGHSSHKNIGDTTNITADELAGKIATAIDEIQDDRPLKTNSAGKLERVPENRHQRRRRLKLGGLPEREKQRHLEFKELREKMRRAAGVTDEHS